MNVPIINCQYLTPSSVLTTKTGLFVTLWKRVGNGPIQPYDIADSIDFFIVSVRKEDNFGQFIFPKSVLFTQEILSKEGKGGKRAIRVYPPWDSDLTRQAEKTQQWQMIYFLEMHRNRKIDYSRAKMLYSRCLSQRW